MSRYRRWKEWSKGSPTSKWYQFLVLIGVKYDLGMEMTYTEEEAKRFMNIFDPKRAMEDDGK